MLPNFTSQKHQRDKSDNNIYPIRLLFIFFEMRYYLDFAKKQLRKNRVLCIKFLNLGENDVILNLVAPIF